LIKQDHLYSDKQLKEMKSQLRVVKEELAELEAKTSKGFGK
jgi:DNA-binding protein YbaB